MDHRTNLFLTNLFPEDISYCYSIERSIYFDAVGFVYSTFLIISMLDWV